MSREHKNIIIIILNLPVKSVTPSPSSLTSPETFTPRMAGKVIKGFDLYVPSSPRGFSTTALTFH